MVILLVEVNAIEAYVHKSNHSQSLESMMYMHTLKLINLEMTYSSRGSYRSALELQRHAHHYVGQRLTDAMLCIVCFYAIAQCGTKQKEHNYNVSSLPGSSCEVNPLTQKQSRQCQFIQWSHQLLSGSLALLRHVRQHNPSLLIS